MTRLRGRYYDGRSSGSLQVEATVSPTGRVTLCLPGGEKPYPFESVRIGSRVGSTPRRLDFPDGGQLETDDNDAVDKLLSDFGRQRLSRGRHFLESHRVALSLALVVLFASAWSLVRYGIPAAAHAAAFALPDSTSQAIGQGALEIMDKVLFDPSDTDDAARRRVQRLFDDVAREHPSLPLRLEFRRGRKVGANAFALPSGAVVITDEMIRLARHDHELLAVLAHEVGHLAQRHALRRVIQGSTVALLTVLVSGDLSSTTALVASLPTVLVEAQYSRAFEREADDYALDYLKRRGIDPAHFANLMRRIEESRPGSVNVPDWLSTHPATEERVRRFGDAGA